MHTDVDTKLGKCELICITGGWYADEFELLQFAFISNTKNLICEFTDG